jgi:hypothetical protein
MQDTSPAARTPRDDEPVPGRVADDEVCWAVTWFEDVDRPVDEPLIALIPLPDLP